MANRKRKSKLIRKRPLKKRKGKKSKLEVTGFEALIKRKIPIRL